MKVAVFGATGVIGRALVPLLAERFEVVAISRQPPQPATGRVEWAQADATDSAAVERALRGSSVAYYLVHSLGTREFVEKDRLAADVVADAATAAGLGQIVYLGGLGEVAPDLSSHLRSRAETGERLSRGSVPVTTLRAAMVVGDGSAAFETIRALVDRLPVMAAPRWVKTRTQPIAIADISRYLAGVCSVPAAIGQSFDAGGPEVMTYREMIERIARLRGKRPIIVEVPILSPRLSSYWLHLVTPVQASVARPLIEGLRNPTVARDDRIHDLVPFDLTSFDDAARQAMSVAAVRAESRR
jgi:uncharacterized protein YbjT (DUF2867 family)